MGQVRDLIGAQGAAAAGVLGPAEHSRFEEGAIDDQLTAALEQIEQAGLPCPWVRRTRTSSPPPSTASVDARRPARHGSESRPSPSRGAGGATPATPPATRPAVFSFRLSGSPFSACLLPYHFSFVFLSLIKTFLKRWQTAAARKRRIGAQAPWIPQRASPPRWTGTWDRGRSPLRLFPSRRRCLRLRTQSRLSVC